MRSNFCFTEKISHFQDWERDVDDAMETGEEDYGMDEEEDGRYRELREEKMILREEMQALQKQLAQSQSGE